MNLLMVLPEGKNFKKLYQKERKKS